MSVAEIPLPVTDWCLEALGSEPASVLFGFDQMSRTWGVELLDGRRVVIKVRPDPGGRLRSVLEVQQILALRQFPCPLPVSELVELEGLGFVHAEAWSETGDIDTDDSPDTARRFAALLARQVDLCLDLDVPAPLPNPVWVCWDHGGSGLWPDEPERDVADVRAVPDFVTETATRVRARLRDIDLPMVIGHADWETQHVRWTAGEAVVVHDWDSLAWLPEAALAGVASGTFASNTIPTLAPMISSQAFLDRYQDRRRWFSTEEMEVAWAASLWTATHNARMECRYGRAPVAERAIADQRTDRLRLAGA